MIEPSVVGVALDTLVVALGVSARSDVRTGLTIGPRNAGVGSGPKMAGWLGAQATRLAQPFVCAGGLGVAFVPIRSIDQAVKTAFDIGLDLHRVDLAPVATARAIGEQVDDLVCVGSGRGWQARMRDFEVLEAMENQQVGADEPVRIVGQNGAYTIARYGWIDVSPDLLHSGQVDVAGLATAVGAAIGVLYESPANLLDGKVIGGAAPAVRHDARRPAEPEFRPEPTIQLSAVQVPERVTVPPDDGGGQVTHRLAGSADRSAARPATRPATAATNPSGSGWGEDRVTEDDPINLFSPDTDEHDILGRSRFPSGLLAVLVLLTVVAAGLGAAYLFV